MKTRTKTRSLGVLLLAFVMASLLLVPAVAFAAPDEQQRSTKLSKADALVCQNYHNSHHQQSTLVELNTNDRGRGYVDEDNDGYCDYFGQGNCAGFVDADGDGYCDLCWQSACLGFVDADSDGYCDICSSVHRRGFVDADGNGVCDNFANGGGRGYIDSNDDGICDNYVNGGARGSGACYGGGCKYYSGQGAGYNDNTGVGYGARSHGHRR